MPWVSLRGWRCRFLLAIAICTVYGVLYSNYQLGQSCKTCSCVGYRTEINSFKRIKSRKRPINLPMLPSAEFYIRMLSARSPPRGDPFDPQINATELRATLKLLWKFLDLCESHGIQVMLYGGTLLGSYRHHGIIPWDDDVDLLMKEDDKGRLKEALDENPDLRLTTDNTTMHVWRVSSKSACLHVSRFGCWPFVDICFYELRNGWIIELAGGFKFPENYTLPAHKRPFMGRWVDSPRDALNFLSFAFEPSTACASLHYSHKFASLPNVASEQISCRTLASTYPFVFRVAHSSLSGEGVSETLRFPDGGPVYTVMVNEPKLSINAEYSTMLQTD